MICSHFSMFTTLWGLFCARKRTSHAWQRRGPSVPSQTTCVTPRCFSTPNWPQTHTSRGVAFETAIGGLNEGFDHFRSKGMGIKVIACILRDHAVGTSDEDSKEDEPSAWATVKQVVAFNKGCEAWDWTIARWGIRHRSSKECTLTRCQTDCSPLRTPASPQRLGRCANRPRLPVDERPISTGKTQRAYAHTSWKRHLGSPRGLDSRVALSPIICNVLRLLDCGVCATVNSDDPAYFGGYTSDDYKFLLEAFSRKGAPREMNATDLFKLSLNGFEAAVMERAEKIKAMEEVAHYFLVKNKHFFA